MNSEKVKDIKKALEEYIRQYSNFKGAELCEEALTLINELESENERLKTSEFNSCMELDNAFAQIHSLENRIAEQYKRIMELEQDLVHADEKVFYRECNVTLRENEIKQQSIKQFAERLKEKMGVREYMGIKYKQGVFSENDIDEILKEFL